MSSNPLLPTSLMALGLAAAFPTSLAYAQATFVQNTYGGTLHDGGPIDLTNPPNHFNANDEPILARGLIIAPAIWLSWDPSYTTDYVLELTGDLTLGNRTAGTELQFYNIDDFGTTRTLIGAHRLDILTDTFLANAPIFEVAGGTLNLEATWSNPYDGVTSPLFSGHGFLRRGTLGQHQSNPVRTAPAGGTPTISAAFAVDDDYVRVVGVSAIEVTAPVTLSGGYLDAPTGLQFAPGGSVSGHGILRNVTGAPTLTATGNLATATILDEGGDYTVLGTGTTALTLDQGNRGADTTLRPTSGTVGLALFNGDTTRATTIVGNVQLNGGLFQQSAFTVTGNVTGHGLISTPNLNIGGTVTPTGALAGPVAFTPAAGSFIHFVSTSSVEWQTPAFLDQLRVVAPGGLSLVLPTVSEFNNSRRATVNDFRVVGPVSGPALSAGELLVTSRLEIGDSTAADAVTGFLQITVPSAPSTPVVLVFNSANQATLTQIIGANQSGGQATIHAANGLSVAQLGGFNSPATFTVHGDISANAIFANLDAHGRVAATNFFQTGESILRFADTVLPASTTATRLLAANGAIVASGGTVTSQTLHGDWTVDGTANISVGVAGDLTGRGAFTGTLTFYGNATHTTTTPTIAGYTATITDAVLNPGRFGAAGSLQFANLTLVSAPTVQLELGGLTLGTGHDVLNVTGALNLGDPLTVASTLRITLLEGFTLAGGESFDVLNFSSIGGTFATLDLPSLLPGLSWDFSALYTTGTLTVLGTVIPEPASFAAFASLAILGFAATRRRRA